LKAPKSIFDIVDLLVGYFSSDKMKESDVHTVKSNINGRKFTIVENRSSRWQKRAERSVKAALVDFLLSPKIISRSLQAIASEVPFLNGKRWVDILRIDSHELIAYEVKSETDSLRRLNGQIEDYLSTFDKTYLVFSITQRAGVERMRLGKRIGLIEHDEGFRKFKIISEPEKNLKIKKRNLVQFIWTDELRKYLQDPSGDAQILRKKMIQRHTIGEIKELSIAALLQRYLYRYKFFMTDRGQRTHIADLDTLTAESHLGRVHG